MTFDRIIEICAFIEYQKVILNLKDIKLNIYHLIDASRLGNSAL